LLQWHHSTIGRKLNGKPPLTQSDELAIRQASQDSDSSMSMLTSLTSALGLSQNKPLLQKDL
jgi:hypothetical protein